MRLKTRITFLFIGFLGVFLFTTVLNSINQQGLLDFSRANLEVVGKFLSEKESSSLGSEVSVSYKNFLQEYKKRYAQTAISITISVIVLLLAFGFAFYFANKHIFQRLNSLAEFYRLTDREMHSEVRLMLAGNDELNMISNVLNKSLNERDEEKLKFDGVLRQERQMILTLLRISKDNIGLFRLNGDLIASNLTSLDEEEVAGLVAENIEILKEKGDSVVCNMKNGNECSISLAGPSKDVRSLVLATIN